MSSEKEAIASSTALEQSPSPEQSNKKSETTGIFGYFSKFFVQKPFNNKADVVSQVKLVKTDLVPQDELAIPILLSQAELEHFRDIARESNMVLEFDHMSSSCVCGAITRVGRRVEFFEEDDIVFTAETMTFKRQVVKGQLSLTKEIHTNWTDPEWWVREDDEEVIIQSKSAETIDEKLFASISCVGCPVVNEWWMEKREVDGGNLKYFMEFRGVKSL